MDRVYNIEKKGKKRARSDDDCSSPAKRGRPPKGTTQSLYPPVQCNGMLDEDTDKRNVAALIKECEKEKPRKELVLQLVKDTCKCS